MKKTFLFLVVAAIAFASCEKQHGDVNLPLVMGAPVTIDVRADASSIRFDIDGDLLRRICNPLLRRICNPTQNIIRIFNPQNNGLKAQSSMTSLAQRLQLAGKRI